jgi:hypothetical protein
MNKYGRYIIEGFMVWISSQDLISPYVHQSGILAET